MLANEKVAEITWKPASADAVTVYAPGVELATNTPGSAEPPLLDTAEIKFLALKVPLGPVLAALQVTVTPETACPVESSTNTCRSKPNADPTGAVCGVVAPTGTKEAG